jgi:glutamine synthetase
MSSYRAEYIWIDGSEPTQYLRSKTKVISKGESPSVWGFDGSSTNQAVGSDSDCVLNPVCTCPDPTRSEDDILVLCEVLNIDMSPHTSNHREQVCHLRIL